MGWVGAWCGLGTRKRIGEVERDGDVAGDEFVDVGGFEIFGGVGGRHDGVCEKDVCSSENSNVNYVVVGVMWPILCGTAS